MTASPSPADRAATLLATIDPLAAAATAGPWRYEHGREDHWGAEVISVLYNGVRGDPLGTYGFTEENAALIVALAVNWPAVRTLITDLVAAVERETARAGALSAAIEAHAEYTDCSARDQALYEAWEAAQQ